MQATSFICDDCKDRIEDEAHPIVAYIVAGRVPMHPIAENTDITDYPFPQILRDLLAKTVPRDEMCVACFCEKFNVPLVDKDGKVLAAPDKARKYLKNWTPPEPLVVAETEEAPGA